MQRQSYTDPPFGALPPRRGVCEDGPALASPADRIDQLRLDRSHGGSWLARHAVETLVQEAASPAATAEELLDHLVGCAKQLAQARPDAGSVAAATGRLLASVSHGWTLSANELRRLVLEEARAILDARDRAAGVIAIQLRPRLEESVVLTHSASATVREAVLRTPPARLVCTVSAPDEEGRAFADELRAEGLNVELVADAEAPRAAKGVRLVLVGADTVYRDGTLANRRGTFAIAQAAAAARVPVVVAAEIIKLAPFAAPAEPADPNRSDLTPPELVTEYVTEDGALAPDQIATLVDRTSFLREGYELIGAVGVIPTAP
jgi:translation initiation factor 2B subunit (eIF-2B alpha/beta/delta family)